MNLFLLYYTAWRILKYRLLDLKQAQEHAVCSIAGKEGGIRSKAMKTPPIIVPLTFFLRRWYECNAF